MFKSACFNDFDVKFQDFFPRDPGSPCQMMIGVYFITSKTQVVFRFHYQTILSFGELIGSLGFVDERNTLRSVGVIKAALRGDVRFPEKWCESRP